MRMFAAVVPPEPVLDELASFLEPRQDVGELRWTRPEAWHLTLAFMAQVPPRAVDDLVERMTRAAHRRSAFPLRLAGAGAFPGVARARVLYAGVSGTEPAREELRRLAVGVRAASNKAGAPAAGQSFRPHLTLARAKHPVEATRWIRALEVFESQEFTVDRCVLVESHLGQGPGNRPRYDQVAEFFLSKTESEMPG